MIVQTLLGKYEPNTQEAWSWFIPLVFPTLTLMISVLGNEASGRYKKKFVRKGFSSITIWLSIAYFVALSLVIFIEPFSTQDSLKLFSISNFFLAPLQAAVVGALGYLFTLETKNVPEDSQSIKTTREMTGKSTIE
ncbi:MAG: hypothetical protein EOO46_20975 [Flavobacterium sp.]|nr:MAG: hypothetical protein EOO46_20975 [Flavobacterium sp.]